MTETKGLGYWLGALSAGVPCLGLSYVLVRVWIDPMAWDEGRWVPYGIGLLMVEFVVIHSGGFIGALAANKSWRSWVALVPLIGMYSLAAFGMSLAIESTEVLYVFGAIMAGRIVKIVIDPSEGLKTMVARSFASIPLYMGVAMFTVLIPVPPLGITTSVAQEVMPSDGGGVWFDHPERPISGAALYFALSGLMEMFWLGKISRSIELPLFPKHISRFKVD